MEKGLALVCFPANLPQLFESRGKFIVQNIDFAVLGDNGKAAARLAADNGRQ